VTIDLRRLTTFLAVADAEGIGLAAHRLGCAQSAVSKRVQQLERELGVALLQRGSTGVRLTPAGQSLAERLRPAIASIEATVERARHRAARLDGTITLAAFPYMLEQIGHLLAELRSQHPELYVVVHPVDFANQLRELREGRADAALLTWTPQDPALELQRLSSHPTYVILSDRHHLANRASLRFDDIADETWPAPQPDAPPAWADQMYMTARRGRRPTLTQEAPGGPDELWPLVASGRAISTIPDYLAPLTNRITGITAIPLEDGDPLVITVARRRENPSPRQLQALFESAARIDAGLAGHGNLAG
jgi:DNA-binding transcriptional LysR family regulator